MIESYKKIQNGKLGFHKMDRGLFEVSGGEAVQFLDGLITNDVKKLEDGALMLAAFPTVKGRIFAVMRMMRQGEKFLIETEEATKQKVYENLHRFTFAGDFNLEDLSDNYEFYRFFGNTDEISFEGGIHFADDLFIEKGSAGEFEKTLKDAIEISDELYEVLRIERGIPKYGVDMDEETVVSELDNDKMISYQKGCYIGQEVIARIHFRGKPAKLFRGLVFESENHPAAKSRTPPSKVGEFKGGNTTAGECAEGGNPDSAEGTMAETRAQASVQKAASETPQAPVEGRNPGSAGDVELKSLEGKNAGFITSIAFSPRFGKTIALGYVRNAFSEDGTTLKLDDSAVTAKDLPFVKN